MIVGFEEMEDKISFSGLADCLEASRERYQVLQTNDGARFVVTRYAGRIFGPFFDENGECPLWTSSSLGKREDFAGLVARRAWNIGGDRVWIAPELQGA